MRPFLVGGAEAPTGPRRGFRPSHIAARGFTMIELLLVFVLLALLMAGAYGGIRTATKSVERGEALIDRTNKLRVAQEFLRRQLGQTLALPFDQNEATGERIVFEGDSDVLTYVSPMPGYLGRGGPYVQNLSFERGNGGLRLVFRHTLLNGFEPDERFENSERKPVVLLEFISSARFEYRGVDETGELGDWKDSWDKPGMSPLLVRIVLEFERDSKMVWPEMVVPLMIDPSAASGAFDGQFFIGG